MKNYLIFLILIPVFFAGCKSPKEQLIHDFLNQYAEFFDEKDFQFVSVEKLDTIFTLNTKSLKLFKFKSINENLEKSDFRDYQLNLSLDDSYFSNIDTGTYYGDWGANRYSSINGRYSEQLKYKFNRDDRFINDNKTDNIFLNNIHLIPIKVFQDSIFNNIGFKNKLKYEISRYYDDLKGAFSADSLQFYLSLEKVQMKNIIGYLYVFKYRVKSKLYVVKLIFSDDEKKLIGYKFEE